MLLALLATSAVAAPNSACAQTWGAQGLQDAVEATESYFVKMDAAGFLAAKNTVMLRLQCVNEPIGRDLAGAVHRVVATAAYLEKTESRVPPALAGLLAADIGYQLPADAYPEGHPVRDLLPLASLLAQDTASRPLATFSEGWLEVDGVHSYVVSTSRASVVQQLDGQGAVVETRYVWPGDDLGSWNGFAQATVDLTTPPKKGKPVRTGLLVSAAGTLVATGVLYGLARVNYDEYNAECTTAPVDAGCAGLRDTANGLTVGYIATGIASLGLGVGVVIAW